MEIAVFKEDNVRENYKFHDREDGSLVFVKTEQQIKWVKDELPQDIEFNDEIESIEMIGEDYCVDIEVSDDHLFIANGILTKNSKGIVDTSDFLCGILYPEELREQNLQIWKIIKNRFGGTVNYKIPVNVDHGKSKVFDADDMNLVGNETQQPKPEKKKKTEVDMKFTEENLDDDLWDD